MPYVIQILGLAAGGSTPADGQFLKEYDPDRRGVSPDGEPMWAHMVTTPDIGEAKVYPSQMQAMFEWKRVSKRWPRRPYDGKPNRPLSAYTITIEPIGIT